MSEEQSNPITRLNAALQGRYRIESELGEGGMATVYLAEDIKHERKVALKVLNPELAAVVGAERFLAQIKTTANLQHPHILPLFDSGEADSFLFYVMPYVEGESLRERLDREHQLPVDDAVRIASDVAEALDHAHRQGVVHRDIKPGNILIHDGRPLIADFGIALAMSTGGGGRLTETGLSLGTPRYMSPEQAAGDEHVGPATDTYSLGCVLYEMLVGEPPYTGSTPQAILGKIIAGKLASATEQRAAVPNNVDAAIRRALEKVPADRFTGAQDFARALTDPAFQHGPLVGAATGGVTEPWKRLTVAFATTTVVLGALAAWSWLQPPAQRPVTRSSIDLGDLTLRPPGEILVSADGLRFAVAGLAVTEPLYWRNADEEEFQPLHGTEGADYASFSPDGESLAFGTLGLPSIQKVALSGGAPQPVANLSEGSAGGIHWGDDGNIVYTLSGGRGLYLVSDTGDDLPQTLRDPSVRVRNPRLLPGGRAVIFTDPLGLSTQLLDLDTDSLRLLRAGAIDAPTHRSFTP